MRSSHFVSAAALAVTLATGPALANNATGGGEQMSIPQIHGTLEAAGYRDIRSIELDRDGYEVKALDPDGQRVKLYVDAATGEVTDLRRPRRDDGRTKSRFFD